ncbi:MAG: protein kinase [Acidobacteriota bacterium]
MEANDLPRIEQLFHNALDLGAEERAAYLARECNGDTGLRNEVESLIAVFEKRADFLETPAFNAGLKVLSADSSESLVGKLIGAYKVERLLGKGGMGEVYLAEDTRLGRQVALKFLARHLAADKWARRQLIKEAQAVAMLDHPNICAVHGLEEADGHSFIVMQYIEGEVLSELARTGRLDAKQTLPLALQMVGALAEAHAHGIIHRDIKPQNLILTASGQLKVLDFGLAKVVQAKPGAPGESQASQSGLIMGTVAYMSPEQLRAERLDFRSDVYSVGTVLYELVSGKHPFAQGNDAETIAAILTAKPPHGANGLARVIGKCLEKNKEQRYQSASELLLDLQNAHDGIKPSETRLYFNPFVTAILFVLLVAGAVLAYLQMTAVPTLAILPFINESAGEELDYLVRGLPDSLASQLARLSRVSVKASTNMPGYQAQEADLTGIGRELDADAILTGKAAGKGETVILMVQLINVADGRQLWATDYDLKQTDALAIQELVATEVSTILRLRLSAEEERLLKTRQTDPIKAAEAFREYLRGRYYWNRRDEENIKLAIKHFTRATELNPEDSRAYSGLADSYVLLTSVAYGQDKTEKAMIQARIAATLALRIDAKFPEAHTSLGVIKLYDWNYAGAKVEFKRAIELNRNYAPARYWYSNLLLIEGQAGEGLAESEVARNSEPFSPAMNLCRCRGQYWTRQFESAAKCFDEMLKRNPASSNVQYILGLTYLAQGRAEQALKKFQDLYPTKEAWAAAAISHTEDKLERKEALAIAALGHTYGRLGRKEEAFRILDRAQELVQKEKLPSQEVAIIYIGLGDFDQAFVWLNRAADERFAYLIYLNIEPLFDSLRADPRFAALVQRINLQPPQV